jgi:hypothetical protein
MKTGVAAMKQLLGNAFASKVQSHNYLSDISMKRLCKFKEIFNLSLHTILMMMRMLNYSLLFGDVIVVT